MFIKEKITELESFSAYILKVKGKDIIIKLKKVNYRQAEFAFNYLKSFNGNIEELKEMVDIYVEDLNDLDKNIIFSDQETLRKFIDIVFVKNNVNTNFIPSTIESLNSAFSNSNDIFNKFISVLLLFGYKLIDLKDFTQKEIMDIAIKEMLYRDPNVLIEFFETEYIDEKTKQPMEGREELYEYFMKKKEELGISTKTNPEIKQSAFDQLSAL